MAAVFLDIMISDGEAMFVEGKHNTEFLHTILILY